MSINKVILVGNVGKDPVVRYFDKGVAKATFPLATSETYTNQKGETITSTEWHNIVLWRALAEVAEKTIKKGSQAYIVGKIQTRSYVDKEGVNKYITEIVADTLLPLEKKQQPGATGTQSQTISNSTAKSQASPAINEPAPGYGNDIPEDVPGNAQTEDDLPF
ncbi:MAG TPA: single-stranded DNA-binding protein [Bacteroidales bacterium]|jgi:single-strand DNA-binding protein|nr:single-stranded DNA-binding protein [Bacteroidales bacterium]